MKKYLETIDLCSAIVLIALGIHTDNLILASIGGFLVGIYNTMIHKTLKEK